MLGPALSIRTNVLGYCARKALADPDFLPNGTWPVEIFMSPSADRLATGGTLGFHCQHVYAHTSYADNLPFALKGVDVIVFSVFWRLGLNVRMRAVTEGTAFSKLRARLSPINLELCLKSSEEANEFIIELDEGTVDHGSDEDSDTRGAEFVSTDLHPIQVSNEGGGEGECLKCVSTFGKPVGLNLLIQIAGSGRMGSNVAQGYHLVRTSWSSGGGRCASSLW